MTELMCPDCGGEVEIDEILSDPTRYDVCCWNCGWVDMPVYKTIEEAQKRIDGGE
jgi:uncharacterized Zn finger protein